MFTSLIVLLLTVPAVPQAAQAAPATGTPSGLQTPVVRVSDSDLAAWVAEGLTHDTRWNGESADALLLRNGRRPDTSIAGEVADRLTAAGVHGMVVGCSGGAVVLRGKVSSAGRRDKATALASGVAGVRTVSNLLTLPDEQAPAEQAETAVPARPTASEPAHTTAFAFLTTDNLAGRDIVVDVTEGVVRLTGEVNTSAAREYANNVASRVPGVRTVRSELQVRKGDLQGDRRLALLVQRKLGNDVIVQTVSNAILVTVVDGVLRLQGSVRDEDQKAQAERVAAAEADVIAVVNELAVDEHLLLPADGRIPGFKAWKDY